MSSLRDGLASGSAQADSASNRGGGLSVVDLTVRYGGQAAVAGFSFDVPRARATGLIGPNGAGKTTTFNACSGLIPSAEGRVVLFGEDVTSVRPHGRAQRGLGRTFQRIELCEGLTVAENVALGPEARAAGRALIRQLGGGRAEQRAIAEATDEAVATCGLEPRRNRLVGLLSTGERRLVELARAIATRFDVLMLDEPSSGLDTQETERLGAVLRQVIAERETGILLVEHDIALVRAVCDYVYVLDFGKQLAEGPTRETLGSDVVRAAYLGSEAVADA